MRKYFLLLSLLIFTFSPLFSDDYLDNPNDYITHCNLSFGISFGLGGNIQGSRDLNVLLKDDYNNIYYFYYNPDDDDHSFLGLNLMLGLPVYYQKFFSSGFYIQALLRGLVSDDSALYFGGGIYLEGSYEEFSLRAGLGVFGISMSKNLGRVILQGDGGKFTEAGENLSASSLDFLGLSFNISVKYYPLKRAGFLGGIFIQPSYTFFPSIKISNYELKLGGTTVYTQNPLLSFKIDPLHQISLMVGIGL